MNEAAAASAGDVHPAADARRLAGELVAALALDLPAYGTQAAAGLELDGIKLGPALEQQLFFALRDGRRPATGWRSIANRVARLPLLAGAAIAPFVPGRSPDPGPGPVVALLREKVHLSTLMRIEEELRGLTGQPIAILRVGRAARGTVPHGLAPPLWRLMSRRMLRLTLAHRRLLPAVRKAARTSWAEILGPSPHAGELAEVAVGELERIALGAAALSSAVDAWEPTILVAFDEVGTWARLLPAVAERHGIPSLDLPHAEAADVEAITGAAYDRMAVYGPHAAEVLRRAGIASERVVVIGAPRFDALADLVNDADATGDAAGAPSAGMPRRIIFAGQYPTAALSLQMIDEGLRAAVAAAVRAAPAEVVAVPHPAEPPGLLRGLLEAVDAPPGVTVRLADGDLYDCLPAAWLLVTCWSNSVLEAVALGVPAVTVHGDGPAPVDFAADRLALAAVDADSAADIAGQLLEPGARERHIATAAEALSERVGPALGNASQRAAQLIAEMQQ